MHANAYECMAVESPSKSYTHTNNKSTEKRTKIASFNVWGLTDPKQLKTKHDLKRLEQLAKDRQQWKRIVACVTDMQVTEPPPIIRRQPHRNAKQ